MSSKFEDLLMKAASVTIQERNLQLPTIEIYKTKHEFNPKFIGEIFVERNISHNLRGNNQSPVGTNSTYKFVWFEGIWVHCTQTMATFAVRNKSVIP